MPTRIVNGVVEYPVGQENAKFSVTMPATVEVGDILLATLESANNAYGIVSAPTTDARVMVTGLASTGGHYHGGVWAVRVASLLQKFEWTWGAAVRGSLAWTVLRGSTVAAAIADVTPFGTSYTAPSIVVPPNSMIYAGISMGSGSATGTWPGGWVQLTDPTQRQGLIASRGVQVAAGATGTVTWTAEPNADGRAWQIAFPDSGGGDPGGGGTVNEGVVEYPAGAESATYSLTVPETAVAGDVILATLESASKTFAISSAPPNSRLLVSGSVNPSADHYHGGVWAVTVGGPDEVLSWQWAGAVRGSLAWALVRGAAKENAVVVASAWAPAGATSVVAPQMTGIPANSRMFIGVSQGSGSATASAPGWTTVVDAAQRNGVILTRGVDIYGGTVSAVQVDTTSSTVMRAWHVAFPVAVSPGENSQELVVIQGIPTSTMLHTSYRTANVVRVRLQASKSPSGFPSVVGQWTDVDPDGWSKPRVTGLDPDAAYYLTPDFDDGEMELVGETRGPIRTAPLAMQPTSFSFAFGGDNQDPTGNTSLAYTNLMAHSTGVRFLLSTGDTHDGDNMSNVQASHRQDWEQVFEQYPGFGTTVAKLPFAQTFGDHDQGGGNNAPPGVWTQPNIDAYEQVMPYPASPMLPNNTAWSFGWGQVRFIGLDCYHERTATYKLSPEQMGWLEDELDMPEPLKVILLSAVWYDDSEPEGWPNGDGWADYPDQRNTISSLIQQSKATGRTKEVLGLHGDQHALSAMSKNGNNFGGFPVVGGSPFSAYPSHKSDVPDSGRWPTSFTGTVHQHSIVSIEDNGANGMMVRYRGYDDSNTVRVSLDIPVGNYTAPAEVPGATIALLTNPVSRWAKAPVRPLWWDTGAGLWRAILPTASGHRVYDLASSSTPVPGIVIDSRQSARVTAFHRAGTTYVLRQHSSGSLFNTYGESMQEILSNVPVPLSAADHDASPIALIRTNNGHLWAANVRDGSVRMVRSINGGSAWSPEYVHSIWPTGTTGVVGLWEVNGELIVLATANDGPGRLVRRISTATADITTGWAIETLPLLNTPLTSDDHLSGEAMSDGTLLLVSKTTGSTTSGEPLLYTLVRNRLGAWYMEKLEGGPDDNGMTRPRLVVEKDRVRYIFGNYQAPQNLYQRVSEPGSISPGITREELLLGPDWSDSVVVPSAADIAANGTEYPILAANRSSNLITLIWSSTSSTPDPDPTGLTVKMKTSAGVITLYGVSVKGVGPIVRGAVRLNGATVPLI